MSANSYVSGNYYELPSGGVGKYIGEWGDFQDFMETDTKTLSRYRTSECFDCECHPMFPELRPDAVCASSDEKKHSHYLKHSHYFKDVSKLDKIDVYSVLALFEVTDPCIQHAVKKLLCTGNRGHKDFNKDVQDSIDSLQRCLELRKELGSD